MTCLKAIAAAAIASVSLATPVFAQDGGAYGPYVRSAPYAGYAPHRYYRESPRVLPPPTSEAYRNLENFGFTGRDPSRVGGYDPNLKW